MKKVDNEIQKELSYNYRITVNADNIINMTDYFNEPQKKSSIFSRLNPSLCIVAVTTIVLLISALTIYLVDGNSIHVNTKFLIDGYKYLDSMDHYHNDDILKQYGKLHPIVITNLDQKAILAIYGTEEKNGIIELYYDFHLKENQEVNDVKVTINESKCDIVGNVAVGHIKTCDVKQEKELNIIIEYDGKKIEYTVKN